MSLQFETEMDLVRLAQNAVSLANDIVGECAAAWCLKYAKGRTDADFGAMVGLTGDQIYARRRVWELFGVSGLNRKLRWSHYYVALAWDDSELCLTWADENQATVAEMKAWRRMQHGEDLTVEAEPAPQEGFADPGVGDPVVSVGRADGSGLVQLNAAESVDGSGVRNSTRSESSAEIVPASALSGKAERVPPESAPYAPYRTGAGGKSAAAAAAAATSKPDPIRLTVPEVRSKLRGGLFEIANLCRRIVRVGGAAARPVLAEQLRELLTDVEDTTISPDQFGIDRDVLVSKVDQIAAVVER